jgi:hypothetical protein
MTFGMHSTTVRDHAAELEELEQILRDAARAASNKRSQHLRYETYKREIAVLHLTPDEYEQAIRRLAEVLGI